MGSNGVPTEVSRDGPVALLKILIRAALHDYERMEKVESRRQEQTGRRQTQKQPFSISFVFLIFIDDRFYLKTNCETRK